MQTDEAAAIIEPRKGRREAPLPRLAVLIFTPQDIDLFLSCFSTQPKRTHRIFLVDVYTGFFEDMPVALAGPMLGAPQAILALEKLIALGVRDVVAVGWCGSLQANVHIGDVVLPSGAVSEEGTSKHYPVCVPDPGPSEALLNPLREALGAGGFEVREGRVWSTDAPYRETVGKILGYQAQGVLAVDMEASALFTVAHFRKIRLAMALVVSDDLSDLSWKHGFREPRFLETRERLAELTLKIVCSTIETLS